MKKERADKLLVQQGFADSIDKAQRMIMTGKVITDKNERIDTAGEKIPFNTTFRIKGAQMKYVSRGGYKLEKAMDVFDVDFKDKILLDIGSSTGGFTDAALQYGAKLSYALDVGTNQLAWKLRQDSRVVVMEQTNFRYSQAKDFIQGKPDVASIDVSFISLKLILPVLKEIICEHGDVIALIKPQFEADRDDVGSKGIIRSLDVHKKVLEDILLFATETGYDVLGLDFSPITGGEGNVEFLAHLRSVDQTKGQMNPIVDIDQTIQQAYATFLN
ncbi:TlyA family RNA methyltransferase [Desemzia sp. RIT804]|uniref:TlyA family RNA methyltransferase n=1 Tax=Desemzia sp. RIT 804 TaxID=2810209 RepID=UPI00194FA196|nr:TlyA family RNA methyltransferase [Desemzia sp. RIT 804]MBM6613370.1 TlyA family RNA methyltransferase [Desemzia sp. RIT 804]